MQYNILSLFSIQYQYQYFSQQYSIATLALQYSKTLASSYVGCSEAPTFISAAHLESSAEHLKSLLIKKK